MRFDLLSSAGLAGRADSRLAWRLVAAALSIYTVAFLFYYPSVVTVADEGMYIRQALLVLEGTAKAERIDPMTGESLEFRVSTYRPGTALMMAPFVWAAGWRGAYLVPLLCLIGAIVFTGLWLREEQRSPLYALLILGFPPVLVMSRVSMSDVPSLAMVSLGLWLFWRGIDRPWLWWLGSGFAAGASMLMRETTVLPFVPFYVGTLVRREKKSLALIIGGLLGVALWLVGNYLDRGDALYGRTPYAFSPQTIGDRLPLYLTGLLVLFPGGLISALAYKGRRRPELVISVFFVFAFFLLQVYSTVTSGTMRRMVLALRYFLPILPVLAFATAEVAPRAWRALVDVVPSQRHAALHKAAQVLLLVWLAGLVSACVGVHWWFDRWSTPQKGMREEIHQTVGVDSVVVTNRDATGKFLRELDYKYDPIRIMTQVERPVVEVNLLSDAPMPGAHAKPFGRTDAEHLLERYGEFYVVFLDRRDSAYWIKQAAQNAALMASLNPTDAPLVDRRVSSTEHLRIWRVSDLGPELAPRDLAH